MHSGFPLTILLIISLQNMKKKTSTTLYYIYNVCCILRPIWNPILIPHSLYSIMTIDFDYRFIWRGGSVFTTNLQVPTKMTKNSEIKKVCQKESALISNAILLIETFEGFCTDYWPKGS